MRVRRALLGVGVVPVLQDRDQPEVRQRREDGGAGARDDARATRQRLQEGPVAGRRAEVGLQPHVPLGDDVVQRRPEPVEVAVVGDDEQRRATRGQRSPGGEGEQRERVAAGGEGRHRPRGVPVADVGEEGRAGLVPLPAEQVRPQRDGVVADGAAPSTFSSAPACRPGTARRTTSDSVPPYSAATRRHSSSVAPDRTGNPDTTRRRRAIRPVWSVLASRSRT